jgi:dienelactone hydrolase
MPVRERLTELLLGRTDRTMNRVRRAAIASLVLTLSGCGGSSSEEATPAPQLAPGGCGMSYDWLPASHVGSIVSSEELAAESRSAQTVDTLLAFAQLSSLSPVPYGVRTYRLRYTTQDRGTQVEATGLVAVPWNEGEPRFDAPLLLELHGTTGFSGPCAPSAPATQHDISLGLAVLASQGYIVVAPDFIGLDADAAQGSPPNPRHAYLNAEQVAVGSLDMVRAARRMLANDPDAPARATKELMLWGPSQGGHAVFATELYAPYYAPELTLRAAVALVPPTDLVGLSEHALTVPGPTTVALSGAMASLDQFYSDGSHLPDLMTDDDPTHFASQLPVLMDTTCNPATLFEGVTDLSTVFRPAALEAAAQGTFAELQPFGCYASESSFSTTSVERHSNTPFLFVLGENDDLVYTPTERDDFERLCQRGYHLEYLECAGAGHVEGATWSIPEQVRWMEAHKKGQAIDAARDCTLSAPIHCEAEQ